MTIHNPPPPAPAAAPITVCTSGLRSLRLHPETIALHRGSFRFDPTTGAISVPIYQASSFRLPGTEGADRLISASGNRVDRAA